MRILLLLLLLPFTGYSQESGDVYADNDILQLKRTADSLNLRYRQYDSTPVYDSWPQTQATYIDFTIDGKQLPQLEARFRKYNTIQQLLKAFPAIRQADTIPRLLAKHDGFLYYNGTYGLAGIHLSGVKTTGPWIYRVNENYGIKGIHRVHLWLLNKPFASTRLPLEYAKMVQYVDCIVDTSTIVCLAKRYQEVSDSRSLQELLRVVDQKRGSTPGQQYIRDHFYKDSQIRDLLNAAVKEAIDSSYGGEALVQFVYGLYPKDTLLLLRRSYQVIPGYSEDDAPSIHATNIAILASQTHQWPVFIRSHLDILHPRLARNAIPVYAAPSRQTYLHELEKLDIQVLPLLLGSVFKAGNLSTNHYYGHLGRIGQAFAASVYTAAFEKQVKACMKDPNLDMINQYNFYLLYTSYCYRQMDVEKAKEKLRELKAEAGGYPALIRRAIEEL